MAFPLVLALAYIGVLQLSHNSTTAVIKACNNSYVAIDNTMNSTILLDLGNTTISTETDVELVFQNDALYVYGSGVARYNVGKAISVVINNTATTTDTTAAVTTTFPTTTTDTDFDTTTVETTDAAFDTTNAATTPEDAFNTTDTTTDAATNADTTATTTTTTNVTSATFGYFHSYLGPTSKPSQEYPGGLVYTGMCPRDDENATKHYSVPQFREGDLISICALNKSTIILFGASQMHFYSAHNDVVLYFGPGEIVIYENYFLQTSWLVDATEGTLRVDSINDTFIAYHKKEFPFSRMHNYTNQMAPLPHVIQWSNPNDPHCWTDDFRNISTHVVDNGFALAFEVRGGNRQSKIYTDDGSIYYVHNDVAIYKQTDNLFIYGNSTHTLRRIHIIPDVKNFTFVGNHTFCKLYGPLDLKYNQSILTDHRTFQVNMCGSRDSIGAYIVRPMNFLNVITMAGDPKLSVWPRVRPSDRLCGITWLEVPPYSQVSLLNMNYGYGLTAVIIPSESIFAHIATWTPGVWRPRDPLRVNVTTPTITTEKPDLEESYGVMFLLVWSGLIIVAVCVIGILAVLQIRGQRRDNIWAEAEEVSALSSSGRDVWQMHQTNKQQDLIAQF
jgi:hypothetical protein